MIRQLTNRFWSHITVDRYISKRSYIVTDIMILKVVFSNIGDAANCFRWVGERPADTRCARDRPFWQQLLIAGSMLAYAFVTQDICNLLDGGMGCSMSNVRLDATRVKVRPSYNKLGEPSTTCVWRIPIYAAMGVWKWSLQWDCHE